jgi:hypothetical protein
MKPLLLFFLIVPVQLSFSSGYKTINYDTIKAVLIQTLGNFNYFKTEECKKNFEPFIVKANELVLTLNSDQDDLSENTIASETKTLCSVLVKPVDDILNDQLIANHIGINLDGDVDDETLKIYRQLYKQTYSLFLPLSQCWVE